MLNFASLYQAAGPLCMKGQMLIAARSGAECRLDKQARWRASGVWSTRLTQTTVGLVTLLHIHTAASCLQLGRGI
jgi:hypothetical protein